MRAPARSAHLHLRGGRSRPARRAALLVGVFAAVAVVLALAAAPALAWAPLWYRVYNGAADQTDGGQALARGPEGVVYVAGEADSPAFSFGDVLLVKYRANGSRKWAKTFDGPANGLDFASDVCVDRDGNIIVVGGAMQAGGDLDIVVIKYRSDGGRRWVKYYAGSANDWEQGLAVACDRSGNIYVVGGVIRTGNGQDWTLIKYGPTGSRRWVRCYDGGAHADDWLNALAVDGSGNVYAVGDVHRAVGGDDWLVVKYSPAGVRRWMRTVDTSEHFSDHAEDIELAGGGAVYVVGGLMRAATGQDAAIRRYDRSGHFGWQKTFTGAFVGDDLFTHVTVNAAGNPIASGHFDGLAVSDFDLLTAKYSPAGATRWTDIWDDDLHLQQWTGEVGVDGHGVVYVSGTTETTLGKEWVLLRYSSAGTPGSERMWAGLVDGDDWCKDMLVAGSGIYLTGSCDNGPPTGNDAETVKIPLGMH